MNMYLFTFFFNFLPCYAVAYLAVYLGDYFTDSNESIICLKPINKPGNTYLEERIGLLCLGPDMAVGVKDARLLQENFRQYALKNFSHQNSIIFVFLYVCVSVFCTMQLLLNYHFYYINY